jgi:hypothetical protein
MLKMKGTYIGAEQALNSVLNFALPVALAALEGTEVAAQYFLLMAAVNLALTIFRGLVTTPIPFLEKNKAFPDYRKRAGEWAIVLFLAYIVCVFLWCLSADETNFLSALKYTLLSIFLYSKEALRSLLLAFGDWGFALVSTLFVSAFCIIGVIARLSGVFDSYFDFLIFGSIMSLLLYAFFSYRKNTIPSNILGVCDQVSLHMLKSHFQYGKFSLMNNFSQAMVIFLVYRELASTGPGEVALFGALYSLVNAASPFFQALNTYLSRRLVVVSGSVRQSINILLQSSVGVLIFSMVYSFSFFITGAYFFDIFYPDLSPVTDAMCFVFALAFSIQGIGYPASRLLVANGRPSVVFESGMIFCTAVAFAIYVGDLNTEVFTVACLITAGRLLSTVYVAGRASHYLFERRRLLKSQ